MSEPASGTTPKNPRWSGPPQLLPLRPYDSDRAKEFHERNKQRYTAEFNGQLVAAILTKDLCREYRVMCFYTYHAWGNHSDCAIDASGVRFTQADCARSLGIDRRDVNEVCQKLARLRMLRFEEGAGYPIVDPTQVDFTDSSPFVDTPRTKEAFAVWVEQVWGKEHPDELKQFLKLEENYRAARTARDTVRAPLLNLFKAQNLSGTPRTNGPSRPEGSGQVVTRGPDNSSEGVRTNGAPSFSESVDLVSTDTSSSDSSSSVEAAASDARTTTTPNESSEGDELIQAAYLDTWGNGKRALDGRKLSELWQKCREKRPTCTGAEIADAIRACWERTQQARVIQPASYLLVSVPNELEAISRGESLSRRRAAAAGAESAPELPELTPEQQEELRRIGVKVEGQDI